VAQQGNVEVTPYIYVYEILVQIQSACRLSSWKDFLIFLTILANFWIIYEHSIWPRLLLIHSLLTIIFPYNNVRFVGTTKRCVLTYEYQSNLY